MEEKKGSLYKAQRDHCCHYVTVKQIHFVLFFTSPLQVRNTVYESKSIEAFRKNRGYYK